jgi:NitT/TauT family transport system substrate-binding protein
MRHLLSPMPALGMVVAASLLVAGCASAAAPISPAKPPRVEKPDIKIGAVPSLDSAALYIAAEHGLFAAQGLHVDIVPIPSSAAAIGGQLAGKYDVTVGGYVPYILAEALHHARFRILAAGSMLRPESQEVVVQAGSPIRSADELKGKSIAVNMVDDTGMVLVSSVLSDSGIPPADEHYVSMPFQNMAGALNSHQVAAAFLPEPFITEAEMSTGVQPIIDTDQGTSVNLPVSGYVVTQAWAHLNPRTAAAFTRAIVEAQAIAARNLAALQQSMIALAGVPRMTAELMTPPEYPLSTAAGIIQRVANLMRRLGLLQVAFDVRPMFR